MKCVIVVAAMASALAACAGTETPVAVAVPEALSPRAGERLAMVVPAKGVQIYECRAMRDRPGAYEWAFVAPEAELLDARGARIGKHYAGPIWEAADGSKIKGALTARADAPQPGNIPWLLLAATPDGPQGAFSKISAIQRVNTVGGSAPVNGCAPANAGVTARVGYTADYYFLSAN